MPHEHSSGGASTPARVTMVFQHFPPFPGAGSLKSQGIARALTETNLDGEVVVRVLTSRVEINTRPEVFQVEGLLRQHIDNAWGLRRRLAGEIKLGMRAIWSIVRSERPDCLVISSPAYITALTVSFAARRMRIPYVLEIRDIYPEVYAAAGVIGNDSRIFRLFRSLSRRMYRGAEAVVTATQGLARNVGSVSGRTDVKAIYNGYPAALPELAQPKYTRFTVAFHGVMGFYQDVETLIAAARELEEHDIDVVVIGYGRKEDLLQSDVPANLHFFGKLPFEQTIAEISKAHIGLCLRTDDEISNDAFPVKLFEYIGLRMPSIVTPVCEGGQFATERDCAVQLSAGDVDGIVSQVLRLRDDRACYDRMVAACEQVGPTLTREAFSREIAAVVRDVVSRHTGGPGATTLVGRHER